MILMADYHDMVLLIQVNKCNYLLYTVFHSLFDKSDVFPSTSRWGSSVQHSHRKHPGCREAGGGVFQNEKCKHRNLYEVFEHLAQLYPRAIETHASLSVLFPSVRCSRLFSQNGRSTSRLTTVLRHVTGLTSWPKSVSATANAWAPTILQPTSMATGSAASSQQTQPLGVRPALGTWR